MSSPPSLLARRKWCFPFAFLFIVEVRAKRVIAGWRSHEAKGIAERWDV
jgi:hypothetical protein